ncbi:MAG: hypothetical protein M3406_04835 [Chloroflexota bacterium]|nr:hypothetical protein [Chloroflexota bacterium]
MTRRRLVWIGAAVLAVLGAGLWATARPGGEFSGLDVRLAAAAEVAGDGGRKNLTDATDLEWDDAHIFGSYTNASQIEAQMDGWSPLSPAGRLVFGDLFLGQDGLQLLLPTERQGDGLDGNVPGAVADLHPLRSGRPAAGRYPFR